MKRVTKLKIILTAKGLTQHDLSDITGLPISHINRICLGKDLKISTAKKIAYALNKTLDQVFG